MEKNSESTMKTGSHLRGFAPKTMPSLSVLQYLSLTIFIYLQPPLKRFFEKILFNEPVGRAIARVVRLYIYPTFINIHKNYY